LDNIKY